MRSRTGPSRTRGARRARSRPAVETPELRELLDHLGQLLAKEYIRLVSNSGTSESVKAPEDER